MAAPPRPPPPPRRRQRQQGRQAAARHPVPSLPLLLSLAALVAAASILFSSTSSTSTSSTHSSSSFIIPTAEAFLLPAALGPKPLTAGPLFARYTSKDTGDRKKKNRARGFQAAKKRAAANRGSRKGAGASGGGGDDEEGGGVVFGDEGSPDGEEEVLELSVDVDELLNFASDLEKALKGLGGGGKGDKKGKGKAAEAGGKQQQEQEAAGPAQVVGSAILNATNLHWLLGQVAYDTGLRQFAVPGLGQMKDAAPLLPDDVEWILTSGLNEKSVRRIPAIDSLRAVYISTMEQALLLEEALQREERRLAERPSFGGVSKSRAKFLEKRAAEKGGKKAAAARAAAAASPLLKAVVLAAPPSSSPSSSPASQWSKEEALALARGIEESCPRLVLWGFSLERGVNPDAIDPETGAIGAVNTLRSMLGRDPVVILPMEGQGPLAQAVTKTQSLAWASLATMVTVEAPDIEVGVVEGIQADIGEDDEDNDEEEGEGKESGEYDPLAAEGDGLDEEEVGLDYGGEVFSFDFEDEDDDEDDEDEDDEGEAGRASPSSPQEEQQQPQPQGAAAERRQGPVSMGGAGRRAAAAPAKKKKVVKAEEDDNDDDDDDDGDIGGAFGAGLDGKGW